MRRARTACSNWPVHSTKTPAGSLASRAPPPACASATRSAASRSADVHPDVIPQEPVFALDRRRALDDPDLATSARGTCLEIGARRGCDSPGPCERPRAVTGGCGSILRPRASAGRTGRRRDAVRGPRRSLPTTLPARAVSITSLISPTLTPSRGGPARSSRISIYGLPRIGSATTSTAPGNGLTTRATSSEPRTRRQGCGPARGCRSACSRRLQACRLDSGSASSRRWSSPASEPPSRARRRTPPAESRSAFQSMSRRLNRFESVILNRVEHRLRLEQGAGGRVAARRVMMATRPGVVHVVESRPRCRPRASAAASLR